jgi:hypothetical protein
VYIRRDQWSDLSIITDKNDSNRTAIMPGSFSKEKDKSDKAFWWWLRSPGEADAETDPVRLSGGKNRNAFLCGGNDLLRKPAY